MSLEKSQSKEVQENNNIQKENLNKIKNQDNNLLLKPKAIKQNIINKIQIPNMENKYANIPPIYQNSLQNQYITENNKINYIKLKEVENPQYINNTPDISKNNINDKGAFSLFVNNNNINSPRNNPNINYIKSDSNLLQNSKVHCTCKKTKCIKKYCECYSSGNLCYNCKCENCENKPFFTENISNQKKEEENDNNNNLELNENDNEDKKLIICTCSKSGCNKNYCECFKAKVKCNNKCRCIKCLNKQEEKKDIEENKIIMNSKSTPINITSNDNNSNNNNIETININNQNNPNNFTVHRISVVINKVQTLINTEKLDSYDSYKFLTKKRNFS